MLLHQRDDISQRRVGGNAEDVVRHHVGDLAAVRAGKVRGLTSRRGEQPQPPRAPALRPKFVTPQQVALGHDAGEHAGCIHHQQSGDATPEHQLDRVGDGCVRRHGDHVAGHDIGGDHARCPSVFAVNRSIRSRWRSSVNRMAAR